MTGLLIAGDLVSVSGLSIVPPAIAGGPSWAALDPRDFTARTTPWVRQLLIHSTKGIWPQRVIPGIGPGGKGKVVADFWRSDPNHSAAHLMVDTNGQVVCLCDLATTVAYHAEASNPWSIGIEMYQMPDGGIYEATLIATTLLVDALCWPTFPIPRQVPAGPYANRPLRRMELAGQQLGGHNLVGVFGHREQTSRRGRGDPGDEIFRRLRGAGFEAVDFDACQDLELGQKRQASLVARGEKLDVDGVCGPASLAAMRRQGIANWRDVA